MSNTLGTQGSYESSTGQKNLKYFDTFQAFSDTNIQVELARNGLADRLCYKIPEEAISDWFTLVDKDGKDLEVNPQIQELLENINYKETLIETLGKTLGFGSAGKMIFDNTILVVPGKDLILAKDGFRQWSKVEIREWFKYPIDGQMSKFWDLSKDQLSFFQYCIYRKKAKTDQGLSYLEPIWDYLQTIDICMKLSPIIVAQITGMKVITGKGLSADSTEDKAFAEAVRTSDKDLVLFLQEGETIDIKYPPQNTFIEQTINWAFTMISAKTGLPVEYLKGNQVGTTSGASQTIDQIDEHHRTLQSMATKFIKHDIPLLAEINDITIPALTDWSVYWNKKAELTETEQANLIIQQCAAVQALIALGYTPEEAEAKVGL